MKTTFDIPDASFRELMRHTRAKTKKAALLAAVDDYNLRKRREWIVRRLGTMEDFMTLDDLWKIRGAK